MSEEEARNMCKLLLSGMDCLAIERGLQKYEVETAKSFAKVLSEKHPEVGACLRLLEWLNSEFVRKRTYE
jgi:hypothetical protein